MIKLTKQHNSNKIIGCKIVHSQIRQENLGNISSYFL